MNKAVEKEEGHRKTGEGPGVDNGGLVLDQEVLTVVGGALRRIGTIFDDFAATGSDEEEK